ncbi:MAG: hypothetical protein ABII82_17135 [Verrucomicrobiota bacterium]
MKQLLLKAATVLLPPMLLLTGCSPRPPEASSSLFIYPDSTTLSPSDLGLHKKIVQIQDAQAVLAAVLKITQEGQVLEHRQYVEFHGETTSMLLLHGTPIWDDRYILRSDFGITINESRQPDVVSNVPTSNDYKLVLSFGADTGIAKTYEITIRRMTMDEVRQDSRIDPKLYRHNGAWGTSFPIKSAQ